MTPTLPTTRTPDPADAPGLRWGILAPGGIANGFVRALRDHTRQQVVAVGSRSAERARAFADRWDIERVHGSYEALVADPEVDVVYVASPHSHHAEQALLAIDAGKHVLVEKSFARNAAEARRVLDAARVAQVVCLEAMWTRFLPCTDIVRQVLDDGRLGPIETFSADHGQWLPADAAPRLHDPDLAGGALLDLGVYPVSYASFVLGTPTRVLASGTLTDTGVDRQVAAVLDTDGPARGLVSTTLAARTPTVAAISGGEGRIELGGPFYTPQVVRLVPRSGEAVASPAPRITGSGGLCHQASHLATLVADGATESPLLPAAETVSIMETLDEIRAQVGVRFPGE